MSIKIIESLAVNTGAYKAGATINPKGCMLHSIGVAQPNAEVLVRNHSVASATVVPHGFMGADGIVYQTLKWNQRGWHCGTGTSGKSANDTHVSLEMTEPGTITYTTGANFVDNNPEATKAFVLATYGYAVEFASMLCKLYGWDPKADGVLISHSEGYKRGIASNHGDVEHIWKKYGLTMDGFRSDVAASLSETNDNGEVAEDERIYGVLVHGLTKKEAESLENQLHEMKYFDTDVGLYEPSTGEEVASSFPYLVQVNGNLNVRSGPGTNYSVSMYLSQKGVYTVIEESVGTGASKWGKLKSGAGWISLDLVTKV